MRRASPSGLRAHPARAAVHRRGVGARDSGQRRRRHAARRDERRNLAGARRRDRRRASVRSVLSLRRREPRRRGAVHRGGLAQRRRISRRVRRASRRQSDVRPAVHVQRPGLSKSAGNRVDGRRLPPVLHRHPASRVVGAGRIARRLRAVRERRQLGPCDSPRAELLRARRRAAHRSSGAAESLRAGDRGRRRASRPEPGAGDQSRIRARYEHAASQPIRGPSHRPREPALGHSRHRLHEGEGSRCADRDGRFSDRLPGRHDFRAQRRRARRARRRHFPVE